MASTKADRNVDTERDGRPFERVRTRRTALDETPQSRGALRGVGRFLEKSRIFPAIPVDFSPSLLLIMP
jgi:hypothetical protein